MPEPQDYAFRPDVRIVVHDADTVEVRTGVWNTSSVTIADDECRGILAEIVLGLWRGESTRTITRRGDVTTDDLVSVVQALLANEVLIPKDAAQREALAPYVAAHTLGLGKANRDIPQRAIVLAPAFIRNLFLAVMEVPERGKISLVDDEQLRDLIRQDLFVEADGIGSVDAAAPFEEWAGSAVVVIWPELHPILLGNLNRLAHHIGFTFLPAVIDGPFSILGPTVVPGLTPCYECAETRVVDAMRDHTLYTQYRVALAAGRIYGNLNQAINPFQAVLVSLAAWETTSLLTLGSAFTIGKLLTIYAPTMEIMFHELVMIPSCPVCGPHPSLDAPLYADLQAYLSAQLGQRRPQK